MAKGQRDEFHPGRQVSRAAFMGGGGWSGEDIHTKTAADAGAFASNNVGHRELSNYAADYARQGKTMPSWLRKEMD